MVDGMGRGERRGPWMFCSRAGSAAIGEVAKACCALLYLTLLVCFCGGGGVLYFSVG